MVTDTDNVIRFTKSLVREMDQGQLTELRAISKPSQELEDIFAAIIMIGEWCIMVICEESIYVQTWNIKTLDVYVISTLLVGPEVFILYRFQSCNISK